MAEQRKELVPVRRELPSRFWEPEPPEDWEPEKPELPEGWDEELDELPFV